VHAHGDRGRAEVLDVLDVEVEPRGLQLAEPVDRRHRTTAWGIAHVDGRGGRAVDVDRLAHDSGAHVDAHRTAVRRDVDLLGAATSRQAQVPGLDEPLADEEAGVDATPLPHISATEPSALR
jgi:hypothetical protein